MFHYLKQVGNRYIVAANITVLTIAWIHLIILFLKAVTSSNYELLHIGSILDLQFVIPGIKYNFSTLIILVIPVLAFYFYLVKRLKK